MTADIAQAQAPMPEELVPARTIERFPVGTFLESIVTKRDGTLVFVDHHSRNIYSMSPEGELEVLANTEFELRGLGLDLDDTLYATGKQPNGVEAVFRVTEDGVVTPWIEAPDGRFLNGLALLKPDVLLAADSFAGVIWRVDVRERTLSLWFKHEWTATDPENARIPGPNGVKLYDGSVYMSNSALAKLIRIPIGPDGTAGVPGEIVNDLVIDDFAFSAKGNLYATTHIYNTVVVLRNDGKRSIIAGPNQGVTGSTAVAFGATGEDAETLYVVGDGGVFMPPESGIVEAELVALEVGESGLTPIESLSWVERPDTVPGYAAYLVQCFSAPGTDALRATIGPQYLRYLELSADRILFAGQLFDDPRAEKSASPDRRLYFVNMPDPDEARRYIEASPYFRAGLYSRCKVSSFNAIVGTLVGGVGWPESATRTRD